VKTDDRQYRSRSVQSRCRKSSAKPASKPTAETRRQGGLRKPKPSPSAAPKELTTMLVAYDESLTQHLAGFSPHRAARTAFARWLPSWERARPLRRANRYPASGLKRKVALVSRRGAYIELVKRECETSAPEFVRQALTTGDTDIDRDVRMKARCTPWGGNAGLR